MTRASPRSTFILTKSAAVSCVIFVAAISSAASVGAVERTENFVDVRKHCELTHLWKDPPDPKAFTECMRQGHYPLHFSPTCQTGSRRAQCYDLQP
ncbi:HAMP domain-containing protein [Rhizobium mongolense]